MSEPKFTKAPWNICWTTLNQRKINFHITASPYGSVRPIAVSDWKAEWSEVEGGELVANAHLISAAPDLYEALDEFRAAHFAWLDANHHYSDDAPEFDDACHRVVDANKKAEAALAKARGEGRS